MRMSPLVVRMFLHCYGYGTIRDFEGGHNAKGYQDARNQLFENRLIKSDESDSGFEVKITQRGQKFAQMILSTPLPDAVWVDPREQVNEERWPVEEALTQLIGG